MGYQGRHLHRHVRHSLRDNVGNVASEYPLKDGYFGKRGDGGSGVRHIEADDPVKEANKFYKAIAKGGFEKPLKNGKGVATTLADGTVITKREVSSSDGSPAVDINIKESGDPAGVKDQKIHFVRRNNEGSK